MYSLLVNEEFHHIVKNQYDGVNIFFTAFWRHVISQVSGSVRLNELEVILTCQSKWASWWTWRCWVIVVGVVTLELFNVVSQIITLCQVKSVSQVNLSIHHSLAWIVSVSVCHSTLIPQSTLTLPS